MANYKTNIFHARTENKNRPRQNRGFLMTLSANLPIDMVISVCVMQNFFPLVMYPEEEIKIGESVGGQKIKFSIRF